MDNDTPAHIRYGLSEAEWRTGVEEAKSEVDDSLEGEELEEAAEAYLSNVHEFRLRREQQRAIFETHRRKLEQREAAERKNERFRELFWQELIFGIVVVGSAIAWLVT